MDLLIEKVDNHFIGDFEMLGDKSIAHRALLIGALGKGNYKIYNFPNNLDCLSTLNAMRKLGVSIKQNDKILNVESQGVDNFNKKVGEIDCGNSGTTVRLISGIIASKGIEATLIGDKSLSKRPMKRIIEPLEKMGAKIESLDYKLPLKFHKTYDLKNINYEMKVDSAQVKSCILLAGSNIKGKTKVIEKNITRDHTERMLKFLGSNIFKDGREITIETANLKSRDIYVPGDISSAAFLICAGLLIKNSNITIKNVLLNKGRCKYLDILKKMGAKISIEITDILNGEEVGIIKVQESNLKNITIKKDEIPSIIDEIPVLSTIAAFSSGTMTFENVDELKHKESNRVEAIIKNLDKVGVKYYYKDEMLKIYGKGNYYIDKKVVFESFKDHRIALAFLVLALKNKNTTLIKDFECTNISFPKALDFFPIKYNLI